MKLKDNVLFVGSVFTGMQFGSYEVTRRLFKTLLVVAFAFPVLSLIAEFFIGPEIGIDASMFRYIGWRLSEGGELYRSVWDNKGPVLFWPQYLGYLVFPYGTIGPGVVIVSMWTATSFVFLKIVKRLLNDEVLSAVALFLFVLMAGGMHGFVGLNSQEAVALFFVICGIGATLFICGRVGEFLLGACVALVFLIKPNLVSFGVAFAVMWTCQAIRTRRIGTLVTHILWSFTGFSVVLLGVSAYFAMSGRLYDLWDATLLFGLLEYGNRDMTILSFWMRWIANRLADPWGGNHEIWQLPLFIALLGVSLVGARILWRRGRRDEAAFLGVWLVLEYGMALLMRQFFEHYLVMVCPVVAILTAQILATIRFGRLSRTAILSIVAVGVGLWYLVYSAGMVYAVRRNNMVDDWRVCLSVWAKENVGDRPMAVIGGIRAAGVMDLLKLQTPQKYCGVYMNHRCAKFSWRKRLMENDLLKALNDPTVEWLFCEAPLPLVKQEFVECQEIPDRLNRMCRVFDTPFGSFYRIREL